MPLTNKTAFMAYVSDENLAELILLNKDINPSAQDNLELSGAWGMIEKAKQSDYSQGKTSETLSATSRMLLLNEAKAILKKYGIIYDDGLNPVTIQDKSIPTLKAVKW